MNGQPFDPKQAVHPKSGGGMNPRDVRHGGAAAGTPTTNPSPKKATKKT